MKVTVVGTGYVGLVSGTCFAEMGNQVVCVDIDPEKVDKLSRGELTIFEPGIEVFLERNLREDRISFTTNLKEGLEHGEVIFLALPTPPGEDGSADLSYVLGVADQLGAMMAADPAIDYRVIVNKSTVPVGTAAKVRDQLSAHGIKPEVRADVVSNPEFLREGVAVDDFMKPERVVVGTNSQRAADLMTALYEPFVRNGNPIVIVDERSSEMIKYAANSFLATKITFMNEVARVCEKVGANVDDVRKGIGLDTRIGSKFLYPGIGYGGSCFPKDVQALVKTSEENGYGFQILNAVLSVNDEQRVVLGRRIVERFGGDLSGKRVAVWGLAFKANTDDVREAPAHYIIRHLLSAGATVNAFDPEAQFTTRRVLGEDIDYADNMYAALEGADVLVICTEWNEFRRPDWERVRNTLNTNLVFDGRNLYSPARMATEGFEYHSIGRPSLEAQPVTAAKQTNKA